MFCSRDKVVSIMRVLLCVLVGLFLLLDSVESNKIGSAWKGLLDRITNKHEHNAVGSSVASKKGLMSSLFKIHGGHSVKPTIGATTTVGEAVIPLFAVKMLLQLALTSINMISWAIPLRNKNFTKDSKLLGIANCFAGGIFLMLAFGHMLPHSIEVLGSIGADRNMAFKYCLVGYLVVFFIEKMAFDAHSIIHEVMDDGHHHGHTHLHGDETKPAATLSSSGTSATMGHDHVHDQTCTESHHTSSGGGALSPKSAIVLLAAMSVHRYIYMMKPFSLPLFSCFQPSFPSSY